MATINQDKLKKGDIILYAGSDWISRAINLFDNSTFSHAALYMGNGKVMESTFSRGGVKVNDLQKSVLKYDELLIKRHDNPNLDMSLVLEHAEKFKGSRYDVMQILQLAAIGVSRRLSFYDQIHYQILKKAIDMANKVLMYLFQNDDSKTTCSEFVYRCYNDVVQKSIDPYDPYNIELEYQSLVPSGIRKIGYNTPVISNGSLISMYYGEISSISDLNVNEQLKLSEWDTSFKDLRDDTFSLSDNGSLLTQLEAIQFETPPFIPEESNKDLNELLSDDIAEIEALLDNLDVNPTDTMGYQEMNSEEKIVLINDLKCNLDEFMIRSSPIESFASNVHASGDFLNQNFTKNLSNSVQRKFKSAFMLQRQQFVTTKDLRRAKNLRTIH